MARTSFRRSGSFSFGENWLDYVRSLDEAAIERAGESLTQFLGDLAGLSFLDVGCGSGLFSLAAHRLGASSVLSFDVDPDSVAGCRLLRERAGDPATWEVREGSILDAPFVGGIPPHDVVYAWGVLHHTGDMARALVNTAGLVKEGGVLYLALYNRLGGPFGSRFWHGVKQFYNVSPGWARRILEGLAMAGQLLVQILHFRNPVRYAGRYVSRRGMSWKHDVRDWLGGLPYEYASPEEVIGLARSTCPGLELERLERVSGLGNNSYLFRRGRGPDTNPTFTPHESGSE
jgi:SAM-dependent methyltransferase